MCETFRRMLTFLKILSSLAFETKNLLEKKKIISFRQGEGSKLLLIFKNLDAVNSIIYCCFPSRFLWRVFFLCKYSWVNIEANKTNGLKNSERCN